MQSAYSGDLVTLGHITVTEKVVDGFVLLGELYVARFYFLGTE